MKNLRSGPCAMSFFICLRSYSSACGLRQMPDFDPAVTSQAPCLDCANDRGVSLLQWVSRNVQCDSGELGASYATGSLAMSSVDLPAPQALSCGAASTSHAPPVCRKMLARSGMHVNFMRSAFISWPCAFT
jgi:hypothetical protein